MSHDDDFKRASLRGRGWRILRGQDQPDEQSPISDDLQLTSDEVDDFLSAGPPPIGMMMPLSSPIEKDLDMPLPESTLTPPAPPPAEDYASPVATLPSQPEMAAPETLESGYRLPVESTTGKTDLESSEWAGLLTEQDEAEWFTSAASASDDPSLIQHADDVLLTSADSDQDAYVTQPLDQEVPEISATDEALPLVETGDTATNVVQLEGQSRQTREGVQALIPDAPERPAQLSEMPESPMAASADQPFRSEGVGPVGQRNEGIPLIEDIDHPRMVDLDGALHSVKGVASLIPTAPETPADDLGPDLVVVADEGHIKGSGGIYGLGMRTMPQAELLESPFGRPVPRQRSEELFGPTGSADPVILDQLVDDAQIQQAWQAIKDLQEAIADQPPLDRTRTDTYQQELLRASELLLQSRENYDDSRAILYRVRTDFRRDQQIEADVIRFRPLLLKYLLGWSIALVVLAFFKGFINDVADSIEAPFLAAAYLPALFGAAGGLFLAYSTLNKHTTVRRDFDSIHVPWYLFTPLIGILMGFLTFLLAVVGVATTVTQDLTDPDTLEQWPVAIWLLAFAAGMQQNWVIQRLRVLRGESNNGPASDRQ